MSRALEQLMADLVTLATTIQQHRQESAIVELLTRTIASCDRAAAEASEALQQRLVTDVKPALETWQRVWPRLGTDQDFSLAVAREARLWSGRLAELAGSPARRTDQP